MKDFLILVTISIVIAFPLSSYFMHNWLENYVYRTKLESVLFLGAAAITAVITVLTIGYKAYQAAVLNPAESIRTT
jgi:ABC-type antimicrobial peptide transport system permease subunit